MKSRKKALVLLVSLLSLLAASCAGSHEFKRYSAAADLPAVQALVILPPDFYYRKMQAHHAWEKWMDLLHMAQARTDLILVGPDEFKIYTDGMITNLAHETNLPAVLKGLGVEPAHAVAVKLTLTESWQQVSRVITDKDKRRAAGAEYESEMSFSADIYHLASSRPVISVTAHNAETVLDGASAADSRPEITRFAKAGYHQLLTVLLQEFGAPEASPRPMRVVESPWAAFRYAFGDLPSLATGLGDADAIEREAALRARITYRYPELARRFVRALLRKEPGVLVVDAESCTGLASGDRIVAANGAPVHASHRVVRALLAARRRGTPPTFTVRRDRDELETSWRCPLNKLP